MRYGVNSHKGMKRETNEDSFNIITGFPDVPDTFVIADGMGGYNSGEIASKMAVDFISERLMHYPENLKNENSILDTIREMITEANSHIYNISKEQGPNFGMGTTLIAVVLLNSKIFVGHVGDSRAYLIRDGKMEKITVDHSFVEEMVRSGSLTRAEAENHPGKNMITRALGCSADIQVDTYFCETSSSDLFIICTDGLTNMLSENEIMEAVVNAESPETACIELVRSANEKGGEDNITVIVAQMQ